MAGPTTERLDSDFQSLRTELQDIKIILARLETKLDDFDELKSDLKSNAVALTALDARAVTLDARLTWLIGLGKWLGGIFLLAAVAGAFSIWGRLGIVENQLKNFDGRFAEMRESISRHQTDSPSNAQMEEQMNRIARATIKDALPAAVDAAIKKAGFPKPDPQ